MYVDNYRELIIVIIASTWVSIIHNHIYNSRLTEEMCYFKRV